MIVADTTETDQGRRKRRLDRACGVYELAKDLGLQPKDLVAKVRAMAIDVANHMSQIEPADADRIRRAARPRAAREPGRRAPDRRRDRHSPPLEGRRRAGARRPRARSPRRLRRSPPPRRPRRRRCADSRAAAPAPARRARCRACAEKAEAAPGRRRRACPRRRSRPAAGCRLAAVEARHRLPPRQRAPPAPPAPGPASSPTPIAVAACRSRVSRAAPQDHPAAGGHRLGRHGRVHPAAGLAPRGSDATRRASRSRTATRSCAASAAATCSTARPPGATALAVRRSVRGGQRPGSFPKKRVAAAGKKLKQTQITTPAEHKRVVRMGDTIAVAELAKKMAVQGREIVKKLWALGMMGVTINQDIDLDTATLIANEFGFQIESTAFNEERGPHRHRDARQPGGPGPPRAGRHHHGPRRPRQDLAARRDPQGQRRRRRGRRHHPAHRRLQGARARRGTSSSSIRRATRPSPPCAPAARR